MWINEIKPFLAMLIIYTDLYWFILNTGNFFNLFNYIFSQVELQIGWSQTDYRQSLPWASLLFQMYTEYKVDALRERRHIYRIVLLQALLPSQDHDLGQEEHGPAHWKIEKCQKKNRWTNGSGSKKTLTIEFSVL